MLQLLKESTTSERAIIIIQGRCVSPGGRLSAMADVDIDKLMRMAAFDHVRRLSETHDLALRFERFKTA